MALRFGCQVFKGMISRPTKWFLPNSPFLPSYYLLKISQNRYQLPNAGDDNQSCRILTVLFNRIDWLWVQQYNIYSSTLFYTNVLISTLIRGCATSIRLSFSSLPILTTSFKKTFLIGRNIDESQAPVCDKHTFIRTTMSDTQNTVVNKRTGKILD